MTAPWSPRPETPGDAPAEPATTVTGPADGGAVEGAAEGAPEGAPGGAVVDELVVLDQLEADLTAVEQAIASLEQVSTEGLVGEAAALRIAAAVSTERFGSRP